MMKMAFVCLDPGVPVFGSKGCSIHCQEVIREFISRGWEIHLFATRVGRSIPEDFRGVIVHKLSGKLPKELDAREQALIGLNDVVHQSLSEVGGFSLVYERYSLWSCSAMKFAHENGLPSILEVNAPIIEEQKRYRSLVDESRARHISAECFRFASSIVAVSESVAKQATPCDETRQKITVVKNGVNFRRFDVPSQPSQKSTVVGFVGTLKPWHGVSELLHAYALAFRKDANLKLNIVGSGPEEESLRKQLSTYPQEIVDSVHWHGSVSSAEIPAILASVDIAVAPYPALERFYFSPLKILEYMAAGKAIVASRIGQIPDLLPDGLGVLVEPGDVNELANAILNLANNDPLRETMGQAAKESAKANHSWESVVDRVLATLPALHSNCGAS